MREAYPALFHDFISIPWNMNDDVVLSGEGCNILNFGHDTYRHAPIDYDVDLIFYFDILAQKPHCI